MLETLTPEQIAKFEVYRDKWIDIGLSTNEVNVEEAMRIMPAVYAAGDLVAPKTYRVYDSPMAAVEAMKKEFDITISPTDFCYGAHDATWLSFYDYFLNECDIKDCEKISGLIDLAKNVGWWLAFDEMVVLTHNPVHVKFDDQDRTHCENDLAIKYRDGWGVAMWHGVRVPSEWILNKKSITTEIALTWENVEQRRAACEILGWDNVIKELNPVIVDTDVDEEVGQLLEVTIPEIGQEKFLRVRCGTGRYFSIPVPKEMKTALEANSWTYGIDKVEFKPEIRT